MNIRCFHAEVRSEMFDNSDARVRILQEVVLQTPDDVRRHLVTLGHFLV